jgi:hypothetical protein
MGCGPSVPNDPNSKRVDAFLKEEDRLIRNTLHILLLGAGDSGKT